MYFQYFTFTRWDFDADIWSNYLDRKTRYFAKEASNRSKLQEFHGDLACNDTRTAKARFHLPGPNLLRKFRRNLTWGGVQVFLLDDRRHRGTPAYVLDDASPRFALPHFDWFLSIIPSDVTWLISRSITRVHRRHETGHYDGIPRGPHSDPAESPSSFAALLVRRFHVLLRAVGSLMANRRLSIRSDDERTLRDWKLIRIYS